MSYSMVAHQDRQMVDHIREEQVNHLVIHIVLKWVEEMDVHLHQTVIWDRQ